MSEPVEFLTVQNRKQPNYKLRFILLILAAAACILLSFVVGRFSINMADVLQILASAFLSAIYGSISYLLSPFPDIQNTVLSLLSQFIVSVDTWDYAMYSVVINIRLPRILAALLVGAALSTAGAAYQGMFQNPLVSPDMLGASAGAAYQGMFQNPLVSPDMLGASAGAGFGACLAIYLSLGSGMVTILAFAGGLIAVLVAYVISRLTKGSATLSMVLAGILVGSLFSASTSYIKLVADTNEQLPEITYWLMGSLAGATMNDVIFAGIIIILGTLPIFLLRWRMNVLTLGEDEAKSMGVNTNRLRFVVIVCATLITAVAVSISDIIGWVGLVIPHFCRMLFGYDYRKIIPAAIIMGGGFLLLVDDVSRTIATTEVPIGILTAFIGAPIFAYLLMMGGKRS